MREEPYIREEGFPLWVAGIFGAIAAGLFEGWARTDWPGHDPFLFLPIGLFVFVVLSLNRSLVIDRDTESIRYIWKLCGYAIRKREWHMTELRTVDFCHRGESIEQGVTPDRYEIVLRFRDRDFIVIKRGVRREAMAEEAQELARYCGVRFG